MDRLRQFRPPVHRRSGLPALGEGDPPVRAHRHAGQAGRGAGGRDAAQLDHPGSGFFRSAFYTPSLIGASVSVAIVWRAMFAGDGPVDGSLRTLGIELGGWVGDVDLAIPMMIILVVWQFGAPMVIFLAGLKQVPAELYEAAEVDGAGPVHRFWKVTVPMLSPVIFFNLLLETIHAFQVFGSAFIISNGSGAPGGQLNFITLYLYKRGFADLQMGYAAAIAWVVLVVVAIIALIMFRTARSWVYYAGDQR
ncbi:carbohydrate ABC transporter permease [Catellatospora coxensis]